MTDAIIQKTLDDIVKPTVAEMNKRGTPFQGVLFVGLMIQNDQPRLVEYNVRFGDPCKPIGPMTTQSPSCSQRTAIPALTKKVRSSKG